MAYIRFMVKMMIRLGLRIVAIFMPIDNNKVCFESYGGRQMSCNPYYIYKYLSALYPNLEYVWIFNDKSDNDHINCVKAHSWKYVYTLLTSKVYVQNSGIPMYIPFREHQLVINTWHGGGAYKRVGTASSADFLTRIQFKVSNKGVTYYLSSSSVFSEIMSTSLRVNKGVFLPIGQPRNDLLFDEGQIKRASSKVRTTYDIGEDEYIVLYAPTYRSYQDTTFNTDIIFKPIIDAIEDKYHKKCRIMVRGHYYVSQVNSSEQVDILDVSAYPYMQELLCAADMLISDYSSCIWDYSFLYRPCFLYVTDLENYQISHSFYTPINTWGFPITKNMEELVDAINLFSPTAFHNRMDNHHKTLGSYENGCATVSVCEIIVSYMGIRDRSK